MIQSSELFLVAQNVTGEKFELAGPEIQDTSDDVQNVKVHNDRDLFKIPTNYLHEDASE